MSIIREGTVIFLSYDFFKVIFSIVILLACGYIKYTGGGSSRSRNSIRRNSIDSIFGMSSAERKEQEMDALIERMRTESAIMPKQIDARTNSLLPKIVKDFPDFEYDEMRERAKNALISYLQALDEKDVSLLKAHNQELREQLETEIHALKKEGLEEHHEEVRIHRMEICRYQKAAGRCIITLQASLECYHYITDGVYTVVRGDREYKYQTKYNIDMVYIQDRELVEQDKDHVIGINCPNCGAPIKNLGAKHCEFCGTPVIELNIHVWSLNNIQEIRTR